MYLIGDLLYHSGKYHVVFDERTDDKRLLFVSSDAHAIVRYTIASPMTSDIQKTFAENSLREFIKADNSVSAVQETPFEDDDRVLYCFGQEE
jgi:hypothetical protein